MEQGSTWVYAAQRHLEAPRRPGGKQQERRPVSAARAALERDTFPRFEVRNLNAFHLESWFYSTELIN